MSIIASAKRPDNWLEIHRNIVTNLNIEFIFVGPNQPGFVLPYNFHFIQSKVKPVQCLEIARRESKGSKILFFADDLLFRDPFSVDRLVEFLDQSGNAFNIASSRFIFNGVDLSNEAHLYDLSDPKSPVMPVGGIMLRDSLEAIGGIDSAFIGVCYDLDVAMRMYERGGKVFLTDVYIEESFSRRGNSFLFQDYHLHDRAVLDSLWVVDGRVTTKRSRPVFLFSDTNIKYRSQGPRGHWRGQGFLLVEYWESRKYFIQKVIRSARIHFSKLKGKFGFSLILHRSSSTSK